MRAAARALRAIYPLLMAATPPLYLAVRNVAQVAPDQVAIPLLALLALTAVAVLALRPLAGGRERAAVVVTTALIVLFTGGSLYTALAEALGARLHWMAFAVAAAFAAALLWGAWRFTASPARTAQATTALSVMALVLFANMSLPLVATAKGRVFFAAERIRLDSQPPVHPVLAEESAATPDIYYIIADAYVREDALRREYGYDNREFIAWLEAKGFYVAERSWANYPSTYQSLASALSMELLDDALAQLRSSRPQAEELDRTPFYGMIQRPAVAARLQARGYRYAQVLTHWGGTDRSGAADIRYKFAPFLGGEFSGTLAGMTLLRAFAPTLDQQHHFVASRAREIAALPGPTFAFLHLLLPHNPYVFDRHGNVIAREPLTISMNLQESAWRLREPYIEQLQYTNVLLRGMIEDILAHSRVPPIIVLQGDHGSKLSAFAEGSGGRPDPRERLAILNAYLVPPAVRARLYPDITPVNSFRVLLSAQFGEDLPPAPDRSFIAGRGPYDFEDVTALLRGGPAPPPASTSSR